MALNVPLLRSSFDLVVEKEPELAARFYDTLFARYPQLEALFCNKDRTTQAKMLTEALSAVMDHLEDAPWLAATLEQLGAKHVEYGVSAAMYPWVEECLLVTLQDIAGDDWSQQLADAWAEALEAVSAIMLEGAASTST